MQCGTIEEQRELMTLDNMPKLPAEFYDQDREIDVQGAETSPSTTVDWQDPMEMEREGINQKRSIEVKDEELGWLQEELDKLQGQFKEST